jgi:hypothetical protein
MKKRSVLFIGILVLVMSYVSEAALSIMKGNIEEQWSNYTFSWEIKQKTKTFHNKIRKSITVCSDKR